MKIENGSLVVTVEGVEKTVPLATIAADAKLKAWVVPADYRADRLFVAVTPRGEAEEIPACDPASVTYLGEVELDAGDAARLKAVKDAKRAEINAACESAVSALAAAYPEREIQSWPQQVKEAEALAADPQAMAPLLAAIAEARSLPVVELASRVRAKMAAYAAASGALIGRRQAIEDLIDVADTAEDVAGIAW